MTGIDKKRIIDYNNVRGYKMTIKDLFKAMESGEKVIFTNNNQTFLSEITGIIKDSDDNYIVYDDEGNNFDSSSIEKADTEKYYCFTVILKNVYDANRLDILEAIEDSLHDAEIMTENITVDYLTKKE